MSANKAVRCTGDTTVKLAWNDRSGQWRADVTCRDGKKTVYVRRAPADRNAVDSTEAYDEAARSAIAFAQDEGLDCQPDYGEGMSEVVFSSRYDPEDGEGGGGRLNALRASPRFGYGQFNAVRETGLNRRFNDVAEVEAAMPGGGVAAHAGGLALAAVGLAVLGFAGWKMYSGAATASRVPPLPQAPAPQAPPAPYAPPPPQPAQPPPQAPPAPYAGTAPDGVKLPSAWAVAPVVPVASPPVGVQYASLDRPDASAASTGGGQFRVT